MNPLLLTCTFLMLLGILTTAEVGRFVKGSLDSALFDDYMASNELSQELQTQAVLHQIRIHQYNSEEDEIEDIEVPKPRGNTPPRKRSVSLQYNEDCPPNNARLNWRFILEEGVGGTTYQCAARLLRRLYGELPPGMEETLLKTLFNQREKVAQLSYADELASTEFEDEAMQQLFFRMLKGDRWPCLLDYITFNKASGNQRKINLMFAPVEVLEAVLDNPKALKLICEEREKLWERIHYEEEHRKELKGKEGLLTRTTIKNHLRDFLVAVSKETGTKTTQRLDYHLGAPGNILFSHDPHTGLTRRERVECNLHK